MGSRAAQGSAIRKECVVLQWAGWKAEVIVLDALKREKSEIKVYVRMFDGTRLLGNVFLANNERLQDIMNDERGFIPVHVDDQSTRSLVMLSKRYIQQVEEVEEKKKKGRKNKNKKRIPM